MKKLVALLMVLTLLTFSFAIAETTPTTVPVTFVENPTTGYRWAIQDSAGGVLRSLGPEVYTSSDNGQLLGSGGQSTWRFQVFAPGSGRLRLTSQQPWEPEAEPAQVFDCPITVN